jgi:hypothetical protein
MASFLSALGVTGVSAPDPSAYKNVQAESLNLTEAKGDLKSTLTNIDFAISTAEMAGLPTSYTSSIKSLRAEADNLMNSNLSSAQLALKNVDIVKKLEEAKIQEAETRRTQKIDDYTKARDTISARVKVVVADKTTSPELLTKYNKLLDDANNSLDDAKKPLVLAKKEGFQTTTATATEEAAAPAPILYSVDDLLARLDDLDTEKEKEESKTFNWQRFLKKVLRIVMLVLFYISVPLGFLFGGIVTSNLFASDHFWAIKVLYFIYGAAFFPAPLLYGAWKKPLWLSGIIPLKSLVPRIIPESAVQPVKPKPPAATGLLSKLKLPTIKMPTIKMPKMPTIPKMPSLFGTKGGGDGDEETDLTLTDNNGTAVDVTPKLSLIDSLFGYTLPEDGEIPTPEQLMSQNILRIICIVELVSLSVVGYYYGAFSVIQKIYNKKWL